MGELTPALADDVRALSARHGVEISALGYYPNPLDPDAETAAVASAHLQKVIAASALERPLTAAELDEVLGLVRST